MRAEPIQTSLEDGVPLHEVTFCAVDLETTGGSPTSSAITEIGAVRYRGGERLGVFHTLVDPREPIPPFITHLTGIDAGTVSGAPPIEAVLPSLLEFVGGAVFVAHNAPFDFGFLNERLRRLDHPTLPTPPVCTAKLARRVVWPDVPNVRLETLAGYFRTSVRPTHRALDDAEACAEVLHGLLELGGRLGIHTLGDLHAAVRARGRPHFAKIRLADGLPASPGVYLFRGREGGVLYVGRSRDVRRRVKSYFYGDGRKKVGDLLAATASVEALACATDVEARALEARLIRRHEPRFNRQGKTWRRYAYVKLDLGEAFPRLKIVRHPRAAGVFLGPFATSGAARLAKEALEDVVPLRRCTTPMRAATRFAPCALADMGRCLAPCDGRAGPERYGESVRALVSSLSNPDRLLGALEARITALAAAERFEEAALSRDRLRALAEALRRTRLDRWLVGAGLLAVRDGTRTVRFADGSLVRDGEEPEPLAHPPPRERADELAAVRGWVAGSTVRVEAADRAPAEPVGGGAALQRLLDRLRAVDRADARRDGALTASG